MKKELTTKQKKNRYRLGRDLCSIGEYISVATPYAVMAGINHNEWFVMNPEPWKIGLGGSIGLILLAFATMLITTKKEKKSISNGMIALLIGWYAVTFVFFLLAQINMEIYKIMAYGGLGLAGAAGLEIGSIQFNNRYEDTKDTLKQVKKNDDIEKATEELKQEKIKVRVKE